MTALWVAAAALTAVVLAGLLPALAGRSRASPAARRALNVAVHRDRLAEIERQLADGELSPEQASTARVEIEQELLRDVDETLEGGGPAPRAPRWVAVLVALVVPIFAFVVYLELGRPEAARLGPRAAPPAPAQAAAGHAAGGAAMDGLVAKLAERLQQHPDDLQGWVMLGRSYASLERHPEAREAFEAAARLAPESPEVLTSLAESTALAAGGDLSGRPEDLLRRALELRPDHPDALWLAGLAASQRQQYAGAISHWERLLALLQNPQEREMVSRYIAEARQQAGPALAATVSAAAPAAPAPPVAAASTAAPAASLTVRVALAAELQDRVSASDTVFIFARPAEGPRMPLAIVRRTVADLPASLTLDDSMAMSPSSKLSSFPQVVISARVSRSGSATPQPGDLEGASPPVSPSGAQGPVDLRIDRQL
jgi:cytochrome c-type biogenesis protein CcmH